MEQLLDLSFNHFYYQDLGFDFDNYVQNIVKENMIILILKNPIFKTQVKDFYNLLLSKSLPLFPNNINKFKNFIISNNINSEYFQDLNQENHKLYKVIAFQLFVEK